MELLMFAVAFVGYFVLFMQRKPTNLKLSKKKIVDEDFKQKDYPKGTHTKSNVALIGLSNRQQAIGNRQYIYIYISYIFHIYIYIY